MHNGLLVSFCMSQWVIGQLSDGSHGSYWSR